MVFSATDVMLGTLVQHGPSPGYSLVSAFKASARCGPDRSPDHPMFHRPSPCGFQIASRSGLPHCFGRSVDFVTDASCVRAALWYEQIFATVRRSADELTSVGLPESIGIGKESSCRRISTTRRRPTSHRKNPGTNSPRTLNSRSRTCCCCGAILADPGPDLPVQDIRTCRATVPSDRREAGVRRAARRVSVRSAA